MAELNSFLNFFEKLPLNKIGEHLSLIADLYIRPLKSWKRILSPRKTSQEYFVTYVLYYAFFVFLINWNLRITIIDVLINLLITLIPFAFLVIPFKAFIYFCGKRMKINRLYRLFFVFYIQITPFIHFPDIIAEWANLESPYQISSNLFILQSLLVIFVVPFIIKISISKRILWILVNYIFAGFYVFLLNLLLIESKDFRFLNQKIGYYNPVEEFDNIMNLYKKSDWYLNSDLLYIYSERVDDGRLLHNDVQYVTLFTEDFMITRANNIFKYQSNQENLNSDLNDLRIYLNKKHLDSLRFEFNTVFYSDLKLMDSLRVNAKFESNRNYAGYVYKYLNQFDSITKDSILLLNIIKNKTPIRRINYNVSKYLCTYQLDGDLIEYKLQPIINMNLKFGDRKKDSSLAFKVFYYPVVKIIYMLYPKLSFYEKFENIELLDDSKGKNNNKWTRAIKSH